MASCVQAIDDAGFDVTDENSPRIGVAFGSGIGGLETIETNFEKYLLADKSPRRISPFFIPGSIINMVAGHVSIAYGIRGPNLSLVTACTTATHNIGVAARSIAYGDADIILGEFGCRADCVGDLDGDGRVDGADIGLFGAYWGSCE